MGGGGGAGASSSMLLGTAPQGGCRLQRGLCSLAGAVRPAAAPGCTPLVRTHPPACFNYCLPHRSFIWNFLLYTTTPRIAAAAARKDPAAVSAITAQVPALQQPAGLLAGVPAHTWPPVARPCWPACCAPTLLCPPARPPARLCRAGPVDGGRDWAHHVCAALQLLPRHLRGDGSQAGGATVPAPAPAQAAAAGAALHGSSTKLCTHADLSTSHPQCPCFPSNAQVVAPAVAYMRMRCLASPAILMQYVLAGTFRGFKDTR